MNKEVDIIHNLLIQIYALQIQPLFSQEAAVGSQQCWVARVVCMYGYLFLNKGTPLAMAISALGRLWIATEILVKSLHLSISQLPHNSHQIYLELKM